MFKTILTLIFAISYTAMAGVIDLIKKGDDYDQQFKPNEALKYYLQAEKEIPNDSTLLVKITRQYVFRMDELSSKPEKMDSAKTALSYAQRAVKAAPRDSDAYLSVAIVYGKMTPLLGNKEKIELSKKIKEAAEKAAKLNPRDDYAWHLLGRWHQALAEMGSFTRGLAELVYGGLPEASNEEAVAYFKKAISLNPDRLIHYIELGRTYAQMGKKEEAQENLNKGLSLPNQEKDDPETKERGREVLKSL